MGLIKYLFYPNKYLHIYHAQHIIKNFYYLCTNERIPGMILNPDELEKIIFMIKDCSWLTFAILI